MKERMPEEATINNEVNKIPEQGIELEFARAVSNLGDLVDTVGIDTVDVVEKIREYFLGLEENFKGVLGYLDSIPQKSKNAARAAIAISILGQLAIACAPRTANANDVLSSTAAITEQYIPPDPTEVVEPTIAVTNTPEPTPTTKPTEVPTPVRPGSGGVYPEKVWSAIESGHFEKQEKAWASMLGGYYGNAKESDRPLFAQKPGTDNNVTYKYVLPADIVVNSENIDDILDKTIVAIETPDYPNTAILPPIDFTKSKGLNVYFTESLPYEKDGHSIPSYLMPTFLTIDANEESVAEGKMQARFLNTTLANIDGELVRINQEGKVVAKIGVKPETQEARWVRPMMEYSGENWEIYPEVSLEDEIYGGQLLYDLSVQTDFVPGERNFPENWEKEVENNKAIYWPSSLKEMFDHFYDRYIITARTKSGNLKFIEVQQVNMGDEQHFLFYDVASNKYGGNLGNFSPSQVNVPGSYIENLTTRGREVIEDIGKDVSYYSKGGELDQMMDEWLITSKGKIFDERLSKTLLASFALGYKP